MARIQQGSQRFQPEFSFVCGAGLTYLHLLCVHRRGAVQASAQV